MSFWDSVKTFLSREAADVKEGIDGLKDRLDAELTRRQEELDATPSERLDMILEDIDSDGSVFEGIEAKISQRLGEGEGAAEVAELDEKPNGQEAPD